MTTRRKSSFRGKVGKDAQKSIRTSRGYLNLPDGVKQYVVEENTKKVMFDILPYVVTDPKHPNRDDGEGIALKGDLWYKRPFKVHRNVGADNESCVCPKSFGKPCPICEYQKKRFGEGADKEETKELYPKDRNLYVVVPIGDKKLGSDPMVWDMSQALFQDILKEALEEDPDNEVFPDLEEGKTLEVSFKWKTLGKITFPEARNINFVDRDEAYEESILDDVPDLDNVLKVLSYEQLSNKFFELDDEEEGEALEEEKPKRERRVREEKEEEPVTERKRKTIPKKEEEEEEEKKMTWSELQNLSRRNLVRICERKKLSIDPDDYDDDEDGTGALREDMANEMEITIPKAKAPKKVEKEEEEEEQEKTPARTPRRERESKNTSTNKCPYKHRFGVDCEKFDDCDTCDLWNECLDAKESM